MIGILGAGLVGRRTAELLARSGHSVRLATRSGVSALSDAGIEYCLGDEARLSDAPIVVVATESSYQPAAARRLLRRGVTVICTADEPAAVKKLLALDSLAKQVDAALVVGAAFSPGVSSLLVGHLASFFARPEVITTARFGTGGPACAREHHRSMGSSGPEIRSGASRPMRAGSGRRLVWFPEPVQAHDCYRAGLSEPILLHQTFPQVSRIQSLQAATRRDRLTARLPMLRPPHPEGLVGATWAEVRGVTETGAIEHRSMAATAPQATGAAALVAALVDEMGCHPRHEPAQAGAHTLLTIDTVLAANSGPTLLTKLGDDVTLWSYDGSAIAIGSDSAGLRAARKWQRPRNRFLTNDEIGP